MVRQVSATIDKYIRGRLLRLSEFFNSFVHFIILANTFVAFYSHFGQVVVNITERLAYCLIVRSKPSNKQKYLSIRLEFMLEKTTSFWHNLHNSHTDYLCRTGIAAQRLCWGKRAHSSCPASPRCWYCRPTSCAGCSLRWACRARWLGAVCPASTSAASAVAAWSGSLSASSGATGRRSGFGGPAASSCAGTCAGWKRSRVSWRCCQPAWRRRRPHPSPYRGRCSSSRGHRACGCLRRCCCRLLRCCTALCHLWIISI